MAETLFYHQVNAYINWLVIMALIIYGVQIICITLITTFIEIRNKILRNYYYNQNSSKHDDGYETHEDLVYDRDK